MTAAAEARERPRVSFWNDPKFRAIAAQVALIALLLWFGYVIVSNTIANLARLNKGFGFEFLGKSAGFDIPQSLIEYSSSSSYGTAILVGFLNTLLIAFLGIVTATVIGFIAGIMRLSKNWLIARVATIYIEFFRNVPLLLQIFIWYQLVLKPLPGPKQAVNLGDAFFLSNRGLTMPKPIFGDGSGLALIGIVVGLAAFFFVRRWARRRQEATGEPFPVFLTGVALIFGLPLLGLLLAGFPLTFDYPELKGFNFAGGMAVLPEFIALYLALSVYTGTYIAEAVRAGIQAVSHGQSEAANALGLRGSQTLRLVVIPQALRVIIPPLASQYLNLTKNSSLAVAIAYPDLVAMGGTVMNQTGHAIEIVVIWMIVYLGLSLITSALMNWYNASMRLVER